MSRQLSVALTLLLNAKGIKPGADSAKKEFQATADAGVKAFEGVERKILGVSQTLGYKLSTSITQTRGSLEKLGVAGVSTFTRFSVGAQQSGRSFDNSLTPAVERTR